MKLFFFFLLSLIVHIFILAGINDFKFKHPEEVKEQIYDVQIVQKPEEENPDLNMIEPMPVPMPTPMPESVQPETVRQTNPGSVGEIKGSSRPSKPMTMPEINIPKVVSPKNVAITMPKINFDSVPSAGRQTQDKSLSSDLSGDSLKYHKSVVDTTGMETAGQKPDQPSSQQQNFFVIKNMNGNRKLVYIPDKPTFSLSAPTSVRAGFKVDREGSTYSIILLNRTDSKIERLAIDFIQKLKFNAVLSDQSEPAEIILYFRVK